MNTKQQTEKYIPDTAYNDSNRDFSALRVRLDTETLIKRLEIYLSGKQIVLYKDDNNKVQRKEITIGKKLLNDLGVHRVMMRVTSTMNTHMAQANLDKDEYYRVISDFHESIADELFVNMEEYELNQNNYSSLVDAIVLPVRVFLTRPVDNLERESFKNTLRYGENNTVKAEQEERRSWVPKFFK